jgi:glycosyltransferase involved in cell wall biosynthesis
LTASDLTSDPLNSLERESFSVLASLYINSKSGDLVRCLQSIADQTILPAQIVIVLDGPVDQSIHDVLNLFSSRLPLMMVPLGCNQGLGKALAVGLEACKHDLVARVDTDDVSMNDRFEKQISFLLARPDVSVVGGVMRENYIHRGATISRDRAGAPSQCNLKKWAQSRNPLNHPTVMFRKNAVMSVGGYVDCPMFEDYLLWVRLMLANHKLANLKAVLVESEIQDDFFVRRGGINYWGMEREFLAKLYQLGFLNTHQVIISIIVRMPLRILPLAIRKLIYIRYLRS